MPYPNDAFTNEDVAEIDQSEKICKNDDIIGYEF